MCILSAYSKLYCLFLDPEYPDLKFQSSDEWWNQLSGIPSLPRMAIILSLAAGLENLIFAATIVGCVFLWGRGIASKPSEGVSAAPFAPTTQHIVKALTVGCFGQVFVLLTLVWSYPIAFFYGVRLFCAISVVVCLRALTGAELSIAATWVAAAAVAQAFVGIALYAFDWMPAVLLV